VKSIHSTADTMRWVNEVENRSLPTLRNAIYPSLDHVNPLMRFKLELISFIVKGAL